MYNYGEMLLINTLNYEVTDEWLLTCCLSVWELHRLVSLWYLQALVVIEASVDRPAYYTLAR